MEYLNEPSTRALRHDQVHQAAPVLPRRAVWMHGSPHRPVAVHVRECWRQESDTDAIESLHGIRVHLLVERVAAKSDARGRAMERPPDYVRHVGVVGEQRLPSSGLMQNPARVKLS